jgi:hypothetical protein
VLINLARLAATLPAAAALALTERMTPTHPHRRRRTHRPQ